MAAGLLVVALLIAPVNPAGAAFPGTNGKIAFEKGGDIFTLTHGGGATPLNPDATIVDSNPAFSDDGTKIAFDSNEGNAPATDFGIYKLTPGGTGTSTAAQVTSGADVDERPAYSPDGTKIAFQRGGHHPHSERPRPRPQC
jgi:Tol biopolymer transport system component